MVKAPPPLPPNSHPTPPGRSESDWANHFEPQGGFLGRTWRRFEKRRKAKKEAFASNAQQYRFPWNTKLLYFPDTKSFQVICHISEHDINHLPLDMRRNAIFLQKKSSGE